MPSRTASWLALLGAVGLFLRTAPLAAQIAAPSGRPAADLRLTVILTRHGVRSPLNRQADLDKFSSAPWPKWDVPPGILTAHGYNLMKLFGAWDRARFSSEGLLAPSGCADAARVTIVADTDQRTRETGKALAEGMLPGCTVPIHSQPNGAVDPLFRPPNAGQGRPDPALAAAAVAGRMGGDPKNLVEAYRPQLAALDRVLSGCGHFPPNPRRTSIFDVPTSLKPGAGGIPQVSLGPMATGGVLAENLLLEYTQGMSNANTGWGCLDGATLREIMQLDSALWEFGSRTPAVARVNASNLLDRIWKTLEQSVTGKPTPGALGKPADRLVILVGHDSNIVAVAGDLRIDWALDGRIDDTPPGGALVFELWRSRNDASFSVRTSYTAQTLEQMRNSQPLTPANPPAEAPIFIPGCSRADLSCSWERFSTVIHQAIDPAYVAP